MSVKVFSLMYMWTYIFHVRSHSIDETRFFIVKKNYLKKIGVATYFVYFFKKENKIRNKTLL